MINLRNSPFLWLSLILLLAFHLAKVAGVHFPEKIILGLWVIIVITCILSLLKYQPGLQFLSTLAIGCLVLSAGFLRLDQFNRMLFPEEVLSGVHRMHGLVSVETVLKAKENAISLKCRSIYLADEDEVFGKPYPDRFILVRIKEFANNPVFPGDRIRISGWVSLLSGPTNPHAFDMRTYYGTLGIRHQLFCKGLEATFLPPEKGSVSRLTARWQYNLSSIVKANTSPDVAQLTNALVWGDRSDLNEEVRDAFVDSGAMHVLSVSGMHMAIIYSMLYLVLGAPGSGTFLRRMIRLACYIVAILCYVGLTGASPAVVRAGLMIMLYLIGKAMGWNTQIWNLLGFAAFLMLWINPYICQNIGFQLSFLAMAGILLYTKLISRSLTFRQIILHRIWEITAVSIAAQVFIVPVLLRQFHQFPLTFMASSLVAMPAGYIIIFGALLNVVLSLTGIGWLWSWQEGVGYYFILCMKWMAGMNPAMHFSLPPSAGVLLLAMAIAFSSGVIYRWAWGKKIAYIMGGGAFLILGFHRTEQWRKDDMTIYHHFSGLVMDIIIDGHCITLQDTNLTSQSIEFATRGNRCYRDVISTSVLHENETYTTSRWSYTPHHLRFDSISMLIWKSSAVDTSANNTITHVLVDECPDIDAFNSFVSSRTDIMVILPAHLNRYVKNKIVKYAGDHQLQYHDMALQGYYRIDI